MNEKLKIILLYILICLIWGTTWLVTRIGLNSLTPIFSAGVRFIVATVTILLFMKFQSIKLNTDKLSMRLYIFMGIFAYAVPFALIYWGQMYVASGLAAVIFAIFPFFVALFNKIFLPSEKIGLMKFLAMIFGFIGIIIIFLDEIGFYNNSFWGMFVILIACSTQAVLAVIIKKFGQHLNPLSINLIPMFIAGILLIITSLFLEDISKNNFDFNGIFSILYLGIIGSVVVFTAYYWLIKKINLIILSLSAFIEPVIALFVGWLLNEEVLKQNQLVGVVLVLFGVLISNVTFKFNFRKTDS